jgi:hypothetical protein
MPAGLSHPTPLNSSRELSLLKLREQLEQETLPLCSEVSLRVSCLLRKNVYCVLKLHAFKLLHESGR